MLEKAHAMCAGDDKEHIVSILNVNKFVSAGVCGTILINDNNRIFGM